MEHRNPGVPPVNGGGVKRALLVVALAVGLLVAFCGAGTSAQATVGHSPSSQFGNGQLAGPAGVAVDHASGSVFVADSFAGVVDEFALAGDFLGQWGGGATPSGFLNFPTQVATDGSTVYVDDTFNNAVDLFDMDGAYLGQLDASGTTAGFLSGPSGVAIDPVNGDVYVADTGNNVVVRFDSAGALVGEIGAGELSGPTQLAVDSAQSLYVLDNGNARVVKYSAGTIVATLDAAGPMSVGVDTSTDHVYVTESGPSGPQVVEYSSDGSRLASFGAGQLVQPAGLAVDAVTGRVYVSDQGAAAVKTFNAVTLATVATTAGATGVTSTDATVAGTVDPEGTQTSYRFEYGTDTNYGNSTPDQDAGNGTSEMPAAASLSGLSAGVTYHFRIVATNPHGTVQGADQTFTTDPAQVSVDGQPAFASPVSPTTATLNGTVNPSGAPTTYHFEYGTDTSYGNVTPDADAGTAGGNTPVSAEIGGLEPGTTYHFRLVADNGIGGPVQGSDATFTTAPGSAPTATDVTAVSANLHATIVPGIPDPFTKGYYHFEYGTDTTYGTSTPDVETVPGNDEFAVARPIDGLSPATTYHFRVVNDVNGKRSTSADATFTTLPAPEVTTDSVTGVTTTDATLHATVDTHGAPGTLTLLVTALDSPYATSTPVELDAADGPRQIATVLADLPAGGDFVLRAGVTAAGMTVYGDQVPFSTAALPPFDPSAPPPISGNPYGCATPHLDAVDVRPRAGRSVTVTGNDLGIAGTIALGGTLVDPTTWTPAAISFTVPAGTSGSQPLTVNCGRASNTVALAVRKLPSNRFTLSGLALTKGTTAILKIKVAGPGKVQVRGRRVAGTTKTLTRKRTTRIAVRLTNAARRKLANTPSHRIAVPLRVRFTPAGGTGRTVVKTVIFKHGGSR
jgi:DNA-binding beta-propeller fold protein YncE